VQRVKIYIPCNFKVNPITHFRVIALFHQNFDTFRTLLQGYVDLAVLIIFTPCQIFDTFFVLLTVFESLPKTCNFTICSIFSNNFETRHPSDDSDQVWFPLV
jgi:hypothetical protein